MSHITKIAAIETTTAIWEYDPLLPDNRVLGGSLDVIAAVRTIAIKVRCAFAYLSIHFNQSPLQIQASGQRIEYFEKLQLECKCPELLKIPLHSNVRWGSAYRMLDRSYKLRQVSKNCQSPWIPIEADGWHPQPINLFLQSADALYGPITTLRRNSLIEKRIRWSAFTLSNSDWERVKDARDILRVNSLANYGLTTGQLNSHLTGF